MNVMMLIQLFGGLGLFLYGMDLMGEGLKKAAGNKLKDILNKVTSNPIKALALGTIVTMIIQSSSATTVLVVGLVNANLMSLVQAAGVILGADIGTTITGQIIALNLSEYAPLFIGLGAAIRMFAKKDKTIHLSECILGFGILFFGISVMSDVLKPLANNPLFTNMLINLGKYPILGMFAGVFVTAVIQSSSASIGLLQALALGGAFAGVEGYDALGVLIPIVLGMNIGTCATAMIAMIGVDRQAKQAAVFHLITKTIGVFWMMSLLFLTGAFSANGDSFVFKFILDISGSDPTKQIANFHTLFNVCNASLLLFLSKPIISFIEKILPVNKESNEEEDFELKLNDILLENPAFAVSEVLNEVETMAELAYKAVNLASDACINDKYDNEEEVKMLENLINKYETGIADFVIKISALDASIQSADFTVHLHQVIHDIERIGDYCMSMIRISNLKQEENTVFSENATKELMGMYEMVKNNLRCAIDAFKEKDIAKAIKTDFVEEQIDKKEDELRMAHIDRLNRKACTPEAGVVYFDIVADLERIGDYTAHIGSFVKEYVELLSKRQFDMLP